tara:strand:- start:894 stop:1076 length:183 start_codon:yes stop_codon:yes gene_type:complete
MENLIEDTPTLNPNSEKLKLYKNSKGYNWEIQLLEVDIERLEKLNNEMVEHFGDQINGSN